MKKVIIAIIVILIIVLGFYYFNTTKEIVVTTEPTATTTIPVATTTETVNKTETLIGKSVAGRDIMAYHYGVAGTDEILLVSGIHGGYVWNTALMAYQAMDYLKANPDIIPANVKVTIIPVLNPDGLFKVVGTTTKNFSKADVKIADMLGFGRFNSNGVDLNRNFDCDWKSTGVWQSKTVSGGASVFSEPESLALKNYIEANKPVAVIAYYAAAGGVYSSNCGTGISAETKALTSAYAKASNYPAYSAFNDYATTGDLTNWLSKINIPAISVLLTNHTDTDWTKNEAGIKALLSYYAD